MTYKPLSMVPFTHPWPEKPLGDVATVVVGGTPSTDVPAYWGGDIPWMASGDVHQKRITDVEGRITSLGLRSSNAALVEPPSVAVALAGQGKTRGTAAKVVTRLCANQSVALIAGKPGELHQDYLFHNLDFRYEELRARSSGGGRGGLSKGILEDTPIPTPDLAEQARIAEVLDILDEAIRFTSRVVEKIRTTRKGLLNDLLHRATREANDVSPLSQLVRPDSPITYGVVQPGPHVEGGIPFIRGGDFPDGRILIDNLRTISTSVDRQYGRTKLHGGEIVVSLVGQPGSCAVVPPELAGANIARQAALIRLGSKIIPEYLQLFISSDECQKALLGETLGSVQRVINLKDLKGVMVPVPKIELQTEIVQTIVAISKCIDRESCHLHKLEVLKSGLTSDLLTGHVRVPVGASAC